MHKIIDSIQAQIAEAEIEFKNLEAAIFSYTANASQVERIDNLETGKATYCLVNVTQPPLSIVTQIKKVADHLRPPLDYLVSYWAKQAKELNHKDTDKNPSFPICISEQKWNQNIRRIKGLSEVQSNAILALHPLKQSSELEIENHPLTLLQELSNCTKHTPFLYVQTTAVQGGNHYVQGHGVRLFQTYTAPFENGAVIASLVPDRLDSNISQFRVWGNGGFGSGAITTPTNATNEEIINLFKVAESGSGRWPQKEWDTYFQNLQLQLEIIHTIMFGKGTETLENKPVLEVLEKILRHLQENIFQQNGILKMLSE